MEESELARAVRRLSPSPTAAVLFLTLCRYPERPQPSLPLLPLRQSPFVTPRRTRPSRRHSSMHSTILALPSMPVSRKRMREGHDDSCALPRRAKRGASRRALLLIPSTYLSLLFERSLNTSHAGRERPSSYMPHRRAKSVGSNSKRRTRSCASSPRCTGRTRSQRTRSYSRSARSRQPSHRGSTRTRRRG